MEVGVQLGQVSEFALLIAVIAHQNQLIGREAVLSGAELPGSGRHFRPLAPGLSAVSWRFQNRLDRLASAEIRNK